MPMPQLKLPRKVRAHQPVHRIIIADLRTLLELELVMEMGKEKERVEQKSIGSQRRAGAVVNQIHLR